MAKHNKIYDLVKFIALIVVGLAVGLGGALAFQKWQSDPVTFGDYSSRFDSPATELILYGTSWCSACKATRIYLAENKINYIDVDIEKSPEASREYAALGKKVVPVLLFRDRTIEGFESKLIMEALSKQ